MSGYTEIALLQYELEKLRARVAELEERRCEICGYAEHHREHTSCLRTQLAKAEQLWQIAQGRCDGLEEKLAKAEQLVAEWQPISTAPKDGRELILLLTPSNWPQVAYSNTWWIIGFSVENKPTHWMPLPKAPNGASS